VPRGKLAVLLAWALTVLDAAVPAYAVGGLGELRDAGGKEYGMPPVELAKQRSGRSQGGLVLLGPRT
jgi:hypothetical protein